MSTVITATNGLITNVEAIDIKIIKEFSDLRWSPIKKQIDVELLNGATSARITALNDGVKGVLGNKGFVLGTDLEVWIYRIHQGATIQVGMAEYTRDLESLEANNDSIAVQYNVTVDTQMRFFLYLDRLEIEYGKTRTTIDITSLAGKTMYPWVTAVGAGSGFSVSINKWRFLNMFFNDGGSAVISTVSEVGISTPLIIDTGGSGIDLGGAPIAIDNITTLPGDSFFIHTGTTNQGIEILDPNGDLCVDTKVLVDLIEPKNATSLTLNGSGGDNVVIDASNNLTIEGGGCVITSCVNAPAGGTLDITNDSNVGIHIDAAGAVTFDNEPMHNVVQSTPPTNLQLIEGTSSLGLEIIDTTGAVCVTGSELQTNVITSKTGADLDLISADSGLGIHVDSVTGEVAFDVAFNLNVLQSTAPNTLSLFEGTSSKGIVIENNTGNVCITGNRLEVDHVYGKSAAGLKLYASAGWLGATVYDLGASAGVKIEDQLHVARIYGHPATSMDFHGPDQSQAFFIPATGSSVVITTETQNTWYKGKNGANTNFVNNAGVGMTVTDAAVDAAQSGTVTFGKNAVITSGYTEYGDMTAPANPGAGLGRLYKKTGDDGIFWKPDAAGAEVDLTAANTGDIIQSTSPNNLELLEGTGGLGLEILDTSGAVCVTGSELQTEKVIAKTDDLLLFNNAGVGMTVKDTAGDVEFANDVIANIHKSKAGVNAGVYANNGSGMTIEKDTTFLQDGDAHFSRRIFVNNSVTAENVGDLQLFSGSAIYGGVGPGIQVTNAGEIKYTGPTGDLLNANGNGLKIIDVLGVVEMDHSLRVNLVVAKNAGDGLDLFGGGGAGIVVGSGGDVAIDNYLQFNTITAPANGAGGTGRLYMKTGDDGLFWLPNNLGAEVDLTATGAGEVNTGSTLAGTFPIFKQKVGVDLQFRGLAATTGNRIGLTTNANTISIDVNQANLTGTGALDSGSITSNFGDIDNGTNTITTAGVTANSLQAKAGNTLTLFSGSGSGITVFEPSGGIQVPGILGTTTVLSVQNSANQGLTIQATGNASFTHDLSTDTGIVQAGASVDMKVLNIGGDGLTISDATGDARFTHKVTSDTGFFSSLFGADAHYDSGGSNGMTISNATGDATFAAKVITTRIDSKPASQLELFNGSGVGITVIEPSGNCHLEGITGTATTISFNNSNNSGITLQPSGAISMPQDNAATTLANTVPAGTVIWDLGTSKLRVSDGSIWIDLH